MDSQMSNEIKNVNFLYVEKASHSKKQFYDFETLIKYCKYLFKDT